MSRKFKKMERRARSVLRQIVKAVEGNTYTKSDKNLPSDQDVEVTLKKGESISNEKWFKEFSDSVKYLYLFCKDVKAGNFKVSTKVYALCVGVIGYVIMPFDAIPEAVFGPVGFIDDALLVQWLTSELTDMLSEYRRFKDGGPSLAA